MKKTKKLAAFLTALVMASVSSACLPAGAAATEDELKAVTEKILESYQEFNDYGYFRDYLDNYSQGIHAHDQDYKGSYLVYSRTIFDNQTELCFVFPDIKDRITVSFLTDDHKSNRKITAEIGEYLGEGVEYDYSTGWAVFWKDRFDDDTAEKIEGLCKQYIDDEIMGAPYVMSDKTGSVFIKLCLDRLYYTAQASGRDRNFDPEAVAELLKNSETDCRIVKTASRNNGDVWAIEFDDSVSSEEKMRTAKLIKDELGYSISLYTRPAEFYDFRQADEISADYTEPKKAVSLSPSETDDDDDSILYGDLNYDNLADITDMSLLSLHLIGDRIITSQNLVKAADVQYDNEVNLGDLAFFQQYISKYRDSLGKYADLNDISEQCATYKSGGVNSHLETSTLMITSVDDYMKHIGGNSSADSYLKKSGLNADEEFFKNNRLAVLADYSESYNGVKYQITSVKTDDEGNIHLFYDRFYPDVTTELAGTTYWITTVPGNPDSETSASVHFSDTHETTDLKSKSRIVNTTNVSYTGSEEYPEKYGIITSKKQYDSEITANGISPEGAVSRLGISDSFFDEYALVYYTVSETSSGPKNRISGLSVDYKNKISVTLTRIVPEDNADQVIKYWFLAAAVPKNLIATAYTDSIEIEKYIGNAGWSAGSELNENSVISESSTGFVYDEEKSSVRIIETLAEFESINSYCSGKYSHLADEFITEDFFKDNVLLVIDQKSRKSNIKYNIHSLDISSDAALTAEIAEFINSEEPEEDDSTEWHLAAAISRDGLLYDAEDVTVVTNYHTQTALSGSY